MRGGVIFKAKNIAFEPASVFAFIGQVDDRFVADLIVPAPGFRAVDHFMDDFLGVVGEGCRADNTKRQFKRINARIVAVAFALQAGIGQKPDAAIKQTSPRAVIGLVFGNRDVVWRKHALPDGVACADATVRCKKRHGLGRTQHRFGGVVFGGNEGQSHTVGIMLVLIVLGEQIVFNRKRHPPFVIGGTHGLRALGGVLLGVCDIGNGQGTKDGQ